MAAPGSTFGPIGSPKSFGKQSALLLSLALFAASFILTRHSQLPVLSSLTAPFTLSVLLLTIRIDNLTTEISPMVSYSFISLIASIAMGNDFYLGIRFLVITLATLLAFSVHTAPISAAWALFPVSLQALAVAALSIFLTASQNPDLAATIRTSVLLAEWGDIYSHDGTYYRVQVIGNALIPTLFTVCLWLAPSNFKRWGLFTSTAGLLATGNLTYIIAAILAVNVRYRKVFFTRPWSALVAASLLTATSIAFYDGILESVDRKFSGDGSSMGVRFDQVDAVIRASSESPASLLTGAGLGSRFPDGQLIGYSDSMYIELQALYFLYQIGPMGAIIYTALLLYLARQRLSSEGGLIFGIYILSGISNPYILDTNQIFVTMLLVHLFPKVAPQEDTW